MSSPLPSNVPSKVSKFDDRLESLTQHYLGAQVLEKLEDPATEEVYVNPDMQVRYISAEGGRQKLPSVLSANNVEAFLRAVATMNHMVLNEKRPALAASIEQGPIGKCRIQGFIPPLTPGPALIIRKPCRHVPSLKQYVNDRILCMDGLRIIQDAIRMRRNVLVVGPTASGKTTLCNAILLAIIDQFPNDRLVILEDTPELRIEARDSLRLQTTETVSMRQLVKYSLRTTPNRIIVGEVRDGSAKDLLDAWITGHPGGCGTVHGETADLALERLADLARDGAAGAIQRLLVLRAIHLVVLINGFGKGRMVREIARPTGLSRDGFELEYLLRH